MSALASLEYDRAFIWHPYASLKDPPPVRLAKSARGVNIVLDNGHSLIDAVSSWWCVAHGHNHPAIVEAIRRQSGRLCHVMFGGFTHEPAVELARRLAELAPKGLDRVFFADSGSISVEVAAKMAIQYHVALGRPGRNRLVALKGGYHGDTSLCMALSDPDGMHTLFGGIMTRHFFAEKPGRWNRDRPGDRSAFAQTMESLSRLLDEHGREIAAVVCEPVFQAANAMNFYDPECLVEMRKLCDEHGVLLVFDEIAAGFHRTGPLWAHLRSGISPDIMTVGKALTGGHVTLAATLASEEVAETISGGRPSAFMHGPTYMANPLACAAALASLELFRSSDYESRVAAIERQLREGLAPLAGLPNVRGVRVLGAAGVVEVERMPVRADVDRVIDEHGVWLRPFSNFIYAMPPLVTGEADVARIVGAISDLARCEPGPEQEDSDFHE